MTKRREQSLVVLDHFPPPARKHGQDAALGAGAGAAVGSVLGGRSGAAFGAAVGGVVAVFLGERLRR